MQYPLISEYIKAIRSAEDSFNQYKALRPVLDDKGDPVMSSGNFAVVFKMRDKQTKRLFAVKCFTQDQEGRQANYRRIAEELEFFPSPYFVHFRFLEQELFVDTSKGDAKEYPVLVMDWVEGEPLDYYLRAHLKDAYALRLLAYRFCRMGAWLLSQPFAHGDLRPDNILVKADGSLVLVDYDGMFVPAMQGEQARESGSPDFRHPMRAAADFNEHIDDFSIATIALSLKAIALQPSLYDQFAASDRLLFAASDYLDLGKSSLLPALCSLTSDAELSALLSAFLLAHTKKSLAMLSFRLFILQEPKKPKVEVLRTSVTDWDRNQAIEDEYGVLYSPDGLRLLTVKNYRELKTYNIKEETKVICDEAFRSCTSLTSIHIPDAVNTIGKSAFYNCSSLTSIHIPNAVNTIGRSAFDNCSSLTSIHLPDSVSTIKQATFGGCKSLTSIYIPDSVEAIGAFAFANCSSLISIHIPNSVTTIGDNPFRGCKQITIRCDNPNFQIIDDLLISKGGILIACLKDKDYITIPDFINKIGDYAFCTCSSLTSIHIPESVSFIGRGAFSGCSSLTSIYMPESIIAIYEGAFSDCKSLTSIRIPESVRTILDFAFSDCKSLTSIRIPESVRLIGRCAFRGCSSLKSIHLPKSIQIIRNRAFEYCNFKTPVYIPYGTKEKFRRLLQGTWLINRLIEE